MDKIAEKLERRRSFRVSVQGTASLWDQGCFIGNYVVKDLSIGGCLLTGILECEVGRAFELELHMPTIPLSNIKANVVRYHIGDNYRAVVGMNFDKVPATFEDNIHDLLVSSLEQEGNRKLISVMVLHPHTETRNSIVAAIRQMGYRVIPVGTPLEAIWALEDSKSQINTLIVSRFIGTCDGQEMMKFIATHFPRIRRIMTGASDALPQVPSKNYAHAIITQPWDMSRLQKVLPPLSDMQRHVESQSNIIPVYEEKEVLSA